MVVDTSAVIAILKRENEAASFSETIDLAGVRLMSAASFLEASLVAYSDRGSDGVDVLDQFVRDTRLQIVPVTEDHARIARDAFVRYGKGRHPAKLNFGDCFSYALAKASGYALLFKGDDFSQTDIRAATLRTQ